MINRCLDIIDIQDSEYFLYIGNCTIYTYFSIGIECYKYVKQTKVLFP
jgi:hypothetical protein